VKLGGTLDRYVLRQWLMTFALSTFGIPAVAVLIRLSETFADLSEAEVPTRDILLGAALLYPSQLAMLFPAGVLFATVFTLNGMGRHSELTAAKAGGVSFYRLIAPMMLLAAIGMPVNYYIQELAAVSTAQQRILHRERSDPRELTRNNFGFESEWGSTWAVGELNRNRDYLGQVLIESAPDSSGRRWAVTADSARWNATTQRWTLYRGAAHLVGDSTGQVNSLSFATLTAPSIDQPPDALVNARNKAEEMRTAELARYLDRLERTGVRPGALGVDLKLKYAIPVACLVVALFGAPLAITSARAGAALGLAHAMGTTLVYLTGIQIMKAIGGKDLISHDLAAWSMNGVFLVLAVVLLVRVKT
jgi:lipopolysaccharide export system permease protein